MKVVDNINQYLIDKYNVLGSYYTSYPAVKQWRKDYRSADFKSALLKAYKPGEEFPLSLYLHFPFCAKLCYFCICHMKVSNNRSTIDDFIDHFLAEIDMFKHFLDENRLTPKIKEIHFGGGSPSHMNEAQFDRVVAKLKTLVNFKDLMECALEIDIRTVTKENVLAYAQKGITRISFGVQDFNPEVQKVINRVQPIEMFYDLLTPDVRKLFTGISFDLIYGLPLQTRESFSKTIELVKGLNPDRMSVYNYCHNPAGYKHQSIFKESDLPKEHDRTAMYVETVKNLLASGFERIGIDHYAKSTDSLAIAKRNKTLHRSFMGYTVGRTDNLIGIGPSALSAFDTCYSQNVYENAEYFQHIKKGEFPMFRGHDLSRDDIIRREVMNKLLSHFYLNFPEIEEKYDIDFHQYFAEELSDLSEFIKDGIMILSPTSIQVTPVGEFFVRHICRVFDLYLRKENLLVIANSV